MIDELKKTIEGGFIIVEGIRLLQNEIDRYIEIHSLHISEEAKLALFYKIINSFCILSFVNLARKNKKPHKFLNDAFDRMKDKTKILLDLANPEERG